MILRGKYTTHTHTHIQHVKDHTEMNAEHKARLKQSMCHDKHMYVNMLAVIEKM